jgi:hypothetical protein
MAANICWCQMWNKIVIVVLAGRPPLQQADALAQRVAAARPALLAPMFVAYAVAGPPSCNSVPELPPKLPPDRTERNGKGRLSPTIRAPIYCGETGLFGKGRLGTEWENEDFKTGALNHSATLP